MRRKLLVAMLCSLPALLAGTPAQALFDDLAISPRARALGEALTTTAGDAWAFYYNPAMLPMVANPVGELSTVEPNAQSFNNLTSAAIAMPLGGSRGGLGIGWRRYGVDFGGTDLATENTLSVAHGFRLFGDASTAAYFGWALNFYNAEFARTIGAAGDGSNGIDPGNAWAVGVDFGAVGTVYDRTRVGFFTRNLNNPTIGEDGEELRRQICLGISYAAYPGVTAAMDLRSALGDDEFRIHSGLEFEVVPQFILRAGLETEPSKLSAGCGIRLPFVTLDYGFSTGGGVLDTSHHFGLSVRWDRREETQP